MIPLRDHIAIRLTDFRGDGTKVAAAAIQAIMRKQAAAGMLASGNTIQMLEDALENTYSATLDHGGLYIGEAAPGDRQAYADLLAPFAWTFQLDLIRAYGEAYPRLGQRDDDLPFEKRSDVVSAKFETIRDRFLGDFKIGMVGGKRMVSQHNQNTISFDNAQITGSNVTVVITQSIEKSGLDTATLAFLGELLRSNAITELPIEAKDAAEAARDELEKPAPDKGKVMRWLGAVARYAGQLGKDVVTAAAKELAKRYAAELGLPPPV